MKKITNASELVQGAVYYDSLIEEERTYLEFVGHDKYGDPLFKYSRGCSGYLYNNKDVIPFFKDAILFENLYTDETKD